jgi:glycogen synthase
MLSALERHHGPLGRAAVIPNGRDPRRFTPGSKQPFVLCAARLWDEAKNAAALDAVAPTVAWPVYLAGERANPGSGRAGPAPAGARVLGRVEGDALAGWYARAAIYALPARYEPFGLSILEAALSGCALVLGDVESLRETWDGAAIFVPPDDLDALREALTRLASSSALRGHLGEAARERGLRFGADRMGEAYQHAYESLVPCRRARGEERPCGS